MILRRPQANHQGPDCASIEDYFEMPTEEDKELLMKALAANEQGATGPEVTIVCVQSVF